MNDGLLCGQAQNGVNFDFQIKIDLEVQGQPPSKTVAIGILVYLWSKFGDPGLNESHIIARTNKDLTHGRTDALTHVRTRRLTQAAIIAKSQNCPQVKLTDVSPKKI